MAGSDLQSRSPLKVAVIDMQPITPAIGGGRLRLLGLYHDLGPDLETTYVGTYDWPGEPARDHQLTRSLTEIDVPLSAQHFAVDADWRARAGGHTIIDAVFPILGRLSADFVARARRNVRDADIVVFAHPWVYPLLADDIDPRRQLLVYDSQNTEALLKARLLGDSPFNAEIAKCVAITECFLVRAADLVLGCAAEDIEFFKAFYRVPKERFEFVPNGAFVDRIAVASATEKQVHKVELQAGSQVALFLGSDYGPNREAARFIVEMLAPALPTITFAICGGVSPLWQCGDLPSNVRIGGLLDDARKVAWLRAADIALNPMFSGSGTNIKMFDYMAAGLPVVATSVGARGIASQTREGVLVCAPDGIAEAIEELFASDEVRIESGRRNRHWVEQDYAWEKISPSLGVTLKARRSRHINTLRRIPAGTIRADDAQADPSFESMLPENDMRRPHIAILSTFGIKCGIAEYTSYLVQALCDEDARVWVLGNRLAPRDSDAGAPWKHVKGTEVERVWNYDLVTWTRSEIDVAQVLRVLEANRIAHLNVQYHRAFLPERALGEVLAAARGIGVGVSVTLHDSADASPDLLAVLGALDATIFVHNVPEQIRLRAAKLRAHHLPQGILAPGNLSPGALSRDCDAPVISTFGFLRPHKGLLELLDAVGMLRRVYPSIRLEAQTALYPAPDSSEYLDRVEARILELSLSGHVKVDARFVEIKDAIAHLARSDVVVLPYGLSDEGSSAAAATALAAGRPLVVTRARIFDDIRSVAYTTETNAPPALAIAIATVVSNAPLRRHLEMLTRHAASERQWNNIARRFLQLSNAHVEPGGQAA